LAVRSGGFYVVTIASLRSGLLVLYVLMMYVSVYPVAITMRSSNTYEERSLGIYAEENSTPPDVAATNIFGALKRRFTTRPGAQQTPGESRGYFIRQQLRGQLAHDLWWICLAVLFITITETGQFERNPVVFSTFNIIFEVISSYGCVGISTGVPWDAYSFSGAWHTFSKLVLCAVMLRGRHRGLPVAIDRAVLLPGEGPNKTEEEDGTIKMERSQLEHTLSRSRTSGSDGLRAAV
jgi:Trk-type K+ transport system membrane component